MENHSAKPPCPSIGKVILVQAGQVLRATEV